MQVPFFALAPASFDTWTRVPGSHDETVAGIRNLCERGVRVDLRLPAAPEAGAVAALKSLGVATIATWERAGRDGDLPDVVLCFGTGVGRTALVWRDNDRLLDGSADRLPAVVG